MHIEDIEYSSNGRRLVGQLAVDDSRSGRRPAILVCHEGNGLGDHPKDRARRLAELGYVAFALDYYGDGRPLPDDQIMDRFLELKLNRSLLQVSWYLQPQRGETHSQIRERL